MKGIPVTITFFLEIVIIAFFKGLRTHNGDFYASSRYTYHLNKQFADKFRDRNYKLKFLLIQSILDSLNNSSLFNIFTKYCHCQNSLSYRKLKESKLY